MRFKEYEVLMLKRFCEQVSRNPRPLDDQKFVQKDKHIWCDDWEIIEILKYFFNGEKFYLEDPPPNRLKNNPLWSKEDIIQKAKKILEECKGASAIIVHLETRRHVAGA